MGIFNLSDSEYEIMEFLWRQTEASTLQDVIAYCTNERNHTWKQQTIYTFLSRLEGKGAVTAVKHGHKRYYSASMPVTEFKRIAMKKIVDECFDGSLKTFLSVYTGGKDAISDEDKAMLLEFAKELEA